MINHLKSTETDREQLYLQAQQNIPTDYNNRNYVNITLIVFLYSL